MKKILTICFLLGISVTLFAQVNLVPNPSFEDTVQCPHSANQIDRAAGWHPSMQSPDYFNECDWLNGISAVPNNFQGYQFAHSGVAYCGFIAYYKPAPNIRETFTCQLLNSLVSGVKYKASFYLSLAGGLSSKMSCNKVGLLFSTNDFNLTNNPLISNYSQVYTDSIITDTLNWIYVEKNFIADSNYNYLTVGNFFTDTLTDTLMFTPFTSYAYYFIDDLSVIQDTTTKVDEISMSQTVIVSPNPTTSDIKIISEKEIISKVELISAEFKIVDVRFNLKTKKIVEYNCSYLPQGIYYLRISYLNKQSTYHKFIKL